MKLATLAVIAFFTLVALSAVIALAVLDEADGDDDAPWDDALADLMEEES